MQFWSSVFKNNRIHPICTSIKTPYATCKFEIREDFSSSDHSQAINRYSELYSCTKTPRTMYNPAQHIGRKPQRYINKISSSKILDFSCTQYLSVIKNTNKKLCNAVMLSALSRQRFTTVELSLSRTQLYGCLKQIGLAVAMKFRYPCKVSTYMGIKHSHSIGRI